MKLVVLGSGSSVPHPLRSSSAFWLETEHGSALLDISADAVHRMAQEKLAWYELDAIWISHFHLDHIDGLAPFLFGAKYAPQTANRTTPLTIFGPPGLKSLLEYFDRANNYELLKQPFPANIREVDKDVVFELLPGLNAQTLSTPHTRESLAIRLRDKLGKSLVYTSDTGPDEKLVPFSYRTDLLIAECSFRANKPVASHMELKEVMELAGRAEPQKLLLAHLYPEWDGIDVAAEARKLWPGEIIEGREGIRIEI